MPWACVIRKVETSGMNQTQHIEEWYAGDTADELWRRRARPWVPSCCSIQDAWPAISVVRSRPARVVTDVMRRDITAPAAQNLYQIQPSSRDERRPQPVTAFLRNSANRTWRTTAATALADNTVP
jgi:hypothetical protein